MGGKYQPSPAFSFTRRNLPHIEEAEATYFVTFRCRRHITLSPEARDIAEAGGLAFVEGVDIAEAVRSAGIPLR